MVPKSYAKKLCTVILVCISFCGKSQTSITCKDFRTGNFYTYPKNAADRYVIVRDEKSQKETNLVNGDSLLWKIDWKGDCSYKLKYISGGKMLPKESIAVLENHEFFYEIESITPDYYLFTAYVDKKSAVPLAKDTIWLHEKSIFTSNELFRAYKTRTIPRKDHFSDTSKYAVLYIYRPGKFTNSLSDYIVYLDENPLWVAKNNSGYVFKIMKEGKYRIKSRLLKKESYVDVDFKFGKTYYVESRIKWKLNVLTNFNLDMEVVKPERGQTEYDQVDFR